MSFYDGLSGRDEHDQVVKCGPWPLEEHKLDVLSTVDTHGADILVNAKIIVLLCLCG